MSESSSYPRYISHQPKGEDLFDGRPQERIAKNIAAQINQPNSRKIIGLDGSWGSGKSNVISILEKELKQTHHVYVYDAWGHQEDLQRKSFLEGLTSSLIEDEGALSKKSKYKDPKGKVRSCTWKQKLGFLLARKRTVDHSKTPEFRAGIFWVVAMIILTPILSLSSGFLDNVGISDTYIFLAKLTFSLSALFLGVLLWLLHSLFTWQNPGKGLVTLFYIYKGRELSYTTYESISDEEPSVLEFKQWMKDISEGLNKSLIIAFDNMDRLPPQKIKELWSSIHTFFAEGHSEYDKISVIIPFDRTHLRTAFDSEGGEKADQFINKTFSIVYRVSPPILTDWKQYFDRLYHEAFGDLEDKQVSTVMNLFDVMKQRFTPRDIIAFINELVALKKLWGEEIEIKYMSLFILKNISTSENPINDLLKDDFLGVEKKYFNSITKVQNNIAALVFNVPLSKAYQVVLHRELELILRGDVIDYVIEKQRVTALNNLLKYDHFLDVLEDVVSKSEYQTDVAIAVLDKLELLKQEGEMNELQVQLVWNELLRRHLDVTLSSVEFTRVHQILMTKVSGNQLENLIDVTCKGFSRIVSAEGAGEKIGGCLYQSLEAMQVCINDINPNIKIREVFPETRVAPQTFLGYLGEAKHEHGEFKIICDLEKLDVECSNLVPEQMEKITVVKNLEIPEDFIFTKTNEKLNELLQGRGVISVDFDSYLKAMKATTNEKPIEPFTEPLLYTLLTQVTADSAGYFDLLAMRLSYGTGFQASLIQKVPPINHRKADPTVTQLTVTDENIVSEVAEVMEYYLCYGDWLELLSSWQQPLLSAALAKLTIHPIGSSSMNVVSVLNNYETIYTHLGVSEEAFLSRLDGWAKWAKEEISKDNVTDTITSPLFFEHASKIQFDITQHIISQMVSHLNELSVDDWKNGMANENSYYFKVVVILLNGHHIKQLPENAVTAYKDLLVEMAKGERGLINTFFGVFYEGINKNKLKATLKNIRDEFITNVLITPEIFLAFSNLLVAHAQLDKKPEDVTRRILTPVINTPECRQFIIDNSSFFVPLINKAGDDAEDLKDIIRQACESFEDEELHVFARSINVVG